MAGCATPATAARLTARAAHPRPRGSAPAAADAPGLTLAAVGDIMLGTDFPENILPDDDGVRLPRCRDADPVRAGRGVRQSRRRVAGRRRAGQAVQGQAHLLPVPHADALRRVSASARASTSMSLANNHARDFGEEGRSSSMAALDAVGIRHSGREGTTASWIANGRRVALVGVRTQRGLELAQRSADRPAAGDADSRRRTTSSSCRSTAAPKAMARKCCRSRARSSPARIAATWSSSRMPWWMPARTWCWATARTWCGPWSCIATG